MRNATIVGLALGLAAAVPAWADIPPLPGELERQYLAIIQSAGQPCDKVGGITAASKNDIETYAKSGLEPSIVGCTNGATYLVAIPPRRPRLDADGKVIPAPPPVVKQLGP